ncbi:MAG: DUF2062 domain-containing protein [Phormidesmis sp.]
MQNSMPKSNAADSSQPSPLSKGGRYLPIAYPTTYPSNRLESLALMERPAQLAPVKQSDIKKTSRRKRSAKRKRLPDNFVLKRFNLIYWQRLLRYFYIRFLRMQGSPYAIARGTAAGVFAGSFPLLGFQTIIGVAIAALIRGNKIMAAVGTWVSNPLTYVPIFALNFQVGRWLLRLPNDIAIPSSAAGMQEWMDLGVSATAALLVGSLVVGTVASFIAYYLGLRVALLREKKKMNRK